MWHTFGLQSTDAFEQSDMATVHEEPKVLPEHPAVVSSKTILSILPLLTTTDTAKNGTTRLEDV